MTRMQCRNCEGRGKIHRKAFDNKWKVRCDVCNGSGYLFLESPAAGEIPAKLGKDTTDKPGPWGNSILIEG